MSIYSKAKTFIAIAIAATPLIAFAADTTPPLTLRPDDAFVGNAKSKVVLIEYSSTSCPHCADFHKNVFPEIEKNYIDTDKILYIYRDFPTNHPGLLGAQLAHCSGKTEYMNYISTLMDSQPMWAYNHNYKASLTNIAKLGGFTDAKINECFNNKTLEESILKRAMTDSKDLSIDVTPTFFLNGKKYTGKVSYADFSKIIEEELSKNPMATEAKNSNTTTGDNNTSTNTEGTTGSKTNTKTAPKNQPQSATTPEKVKKNFDGVITGGVTEATKIAPQQ